MSSLIPITLNARATPIPPQARAAFLNPTWIQIEPGRLSDDEIAAIKEECRQILQNRLATSRRIILEIEREKLRTQREDELRTAREQRFQRFQLVVSVVSSLIGAIIGAVATLAATLIGK